MLDLCREITNTVKIFKEKKDKPLEAICEIFKKRL